ncbi:hypothetical protein CN637_07040 [Bacillus toyonensis]|uniref:hypothetical protein n=1 Tax=Bacillus toyonensis TaxID=155322 RepID=UPI0001A06F10|nr:hypothetical protein [Bacillus toyonensis]EEL22921.1 hypothetical protein bcere0017_22710 [Bacillus cereus Rock1-3]KAB2405550.1 hypothetical protein F8514_20985 [Bacillus toyonensis]PEL70536.1 hypothetical protein CN637_07040 [Bacillus toyonensis]PGE94609.1 hypothetical protein COM61_32425 [Bacillus toyonensis]PHE44122.1 hypothetical protein COF71_24845 [Bacillus toyonensis]
MGLVPKKVKFETPRVPLEAKQEDKHNLKKLGYVIRLDNKELIPLYNSGKNIYLQKYQHTLKIDQTDHSYLKEHFY